MGKETQETDFGAKNKVGIVEEEIACGNDNTPVILQEETEKMFYCAELRDLFNRTLHGCHHHPFPLVTLEGM